jgi:opacity protein-like surface antigen
MPVSIFLTAGAGAAMASITEIAYRGRTIVASGSSTQLAYQGGLGVGSELTKNITIDLTYKYMGTTPFKFSGVSAEYGSHNILVGARYLFKCLLRRIWLSVV